MRKISILALFVLLPAFALAQFTTVTGTVIDPDGLHYAYGTITPILVNNSGQTPTLNGLPYTPPQQFSGLDINGSFRMQLADTSVLRPAGLKWNFQVCSGFGTVPPALGPGSQCFTLVSPISITGGSTDISTQLNAVALALTFFTGGGGIPAGSTQQLQFNDVGVFGGACGLIWDKLGITFTIQACSAATVGANVNSPPLRLTNHWNNGTVSASDEFDVETMVRPLASLTPRSMLHTVHIGIIPSSPGNCSNGPCFSDNFDPEGTIGIPAQGCNHDDVSIFITNAVACRSVEATGDATHTAAVLAAVTSAVSTSARTALANYASGPAWWHGWIMDPNSNFTSQEGARFCVGGACENYFLYDRGTHRIYLGGDAWQAGTHSAFNCGVATAGGSGSQDCQFNGPLTYLTLATSSNCANASGTCGAAPTGHVSIAAAATTVTVSTTAVTANSDILLNEDATVGSLLSVTCNTTAGRTYMVTARTAGTSFTITASGAPSTNPACLTYHVVN